MAKSFSKMVSAATGWTNACYNVEFGPQSEYSDSELKYNHLTEQQVLEEDNLSESSTSVWANYMIHFSWVCPQDQQTNVACKFCV